MARAKSQKPRALGNAGYYGSLSDETMLGYREWRKRWRRQLRGLTLRLVRTRYVNYAKAWRIHHVHE